MPGPPYSRIDRVAFRVGIALPALLVLALRPPDAGSQIGFNCGSQHSITGLDGIDYLPDAEWQEGAAGGYIGGAVLQWNSTGLHHDGPEWESDGMGLSLVGEFRGASLIEKLSKLQQRLQGHRGQFLKLMS